MTSPEHKENTEMNPNAIDDIIRAEIYKALETLGADIELLGAVGSWKDTLEDLDVLDLLKDWNEENARPAPVVAESTIPEAGKSRRVELTKERERHLLNCIDVWKRRHEEAQGIIKALQHKNHVDHGAAMHKNSECCYLEEQLSTANAALLLAQGENAVKDEVLKSIHGHVSALGNPKYDTQNRRGLIIERIEKALSGHSSRAMIEEMERKTRALESISDILKDFPKDEQMGTNKLFQVVQIIHAALNPQKKEQDGK